MIWLVIMLLLSAYRVILIGPEVGKVPLAESAAGLYTGIRFDSVVASIAVLPALLLSTLEYFIGRHIGSRVLRPALLLVFFIVSALVYIANAGFYRAFGTQLDERVLALLHDYDGALGATIWQAYHPILIALMAVAIGIGGSLLSLALASRVKPGRLAGLRGPARWVVILLAAILMVGLVRGISWGISPIRIHSAHVTSSVPFNRLVPSPYAFFLYALEDSTTENTAPSAAELEKALRDFALATHRTLPRDGTLAQRLSRQAEGAAQHPQHIFLILMEGEHGFPLVPKYQPWRFYPELMELKTEGASFENFIPSGRQTDKTLSALVSGTLTPDLTVLKESGAHRETATAMAQHFNRLGYDTHFFYGGAAGWQRLDEFVLDQGFQHMHAAAEMPGAPGNSWGVWDRYLFDHVLATVDPSRPSFTMILTTTNHAPFDMGEADLPPLPALPAAAKRWSPEVLLMLRHEIYAQREVARFIRAAEQRYPGSLFVITGDHTAHGDSYVLPGATDLDMLTVPLIILGDALPNHLRGVHLRPASHMDIAPTLYELAAPAGFTYVSLGDNLFSAQPPRPGLGDSDVLLDGWLASTDSPTVRPLAGQAGGDRPTSAIDVARREHRAVRIISRALLYGP